MNKEAAYPTEYDSPQDDHQPMAQMHEVVERLGMLADELEKAYALMERRLADYICPQDEDNNRLATPVSPVRAQMASTLHSVADRYENVKFRFVRLTDQFQG